jgi:hypothetical protein
MFSLDVVDTDSFLDLPTSTQCLYFHLGMRADDDGFVSSPKRIASMVNCGDDDLKLLIAKRYILHFQSGIVVITDWKMNNYIRSDRYTETKYKNERDCLIEDVNHKYVLKDMSNIEWIQNGYYSDTVGIPIDNQNAYQRKAQVSVDKDRKEKNSIFSQTSPEYALAEYLFNLILKNNPNHKKPNFQKWAKQFDSILRVDRRDIEEVKQLIQFSQSDSFWFKVILSPERLRNNYETLSEQLSMVGRVIADVSGGKQERQRRLEDIF